MIRAINWTPGTWVTTGDGTTVHAGSEQGESIAEAYPITDGAGDAKANATLIAASKDLYYALAGLLSNPTVRATAPDHLLACGDEALARARGQEGK